MATVKFVTVRGSGNLGDDENKPSQVNPVTVEVPIK